MLVMVQVLGALLILAPFAAHQFGKLRSDMPVYRAAVTARSILHERPAKHR